MKKFLSILLAMIFTIGISSMVYAESQQKMNHVFLDSRDPQKFKTSLDKFLKKKKKDFQIELSELIVDETFKDKIELPVWCCEFRQIGSEESAGSLMFFEDRKNQLDFMSILRDAKDIDAEVEAEVFEKMMRAILQNLGMNSTEIDELFNSPGNDKTAFCQKLGRYITISLGQSGAIFRIYASTPAK